ncbi:MAG: translation initiation factor 2 subunit 2 [Candidatus Woesearchaeota archaeon]|nr:translation initiation factor 2 subunit 2 [Candidatus Woesearchaeota archaeon]MDN5328140.1 translation initiation factor 2 subunit 2 [Candidatus Woesearchaeota archaeon]
MNYEDALNRAYDKIPKKLKEQTRFNIREAVVRIEGNKTMIANFSQICSDLRRDSQHLLKFLQRELATPGEIKGKALFLGTRISASRINQKIKEYVDAFVICPDCKRPDTELVKEKGFMFMKCLACGAKRPVKNI